MKNLKHPYSIILSFVLLISLTSCKQDLVVGIDNPTSQAIQFTIDDLTYKIAANKLGYYDIKSGEHTIIFGNDSFNIELDKSKLYFLNPTRSNYIIEEMTYGERKLPIGDDLQDKMRRELNKRDHLDRMVIDTITIEIDNESSITLVGFLRKTHDLLIERNWSYDVTQPFPEQIKIRTTELGEIVGVQEARIKIFRESDFVERLLDEYQEL